LMLVPSLCPIIKVGIVMVPSVPLMFGGGLPGTLFTMTTPIAPAFWAFLTFNTKLHVPPVGPRSIRAIFPLTAAEFVNAEQPSVLEGPMLSEASRA
jgi:hypothetical protein